MQGFNTQIRYFKLTAPYPLISGAVVLDVFPKSDAMPALEVLSVPSPYGIEDVGEYICWPVLCEVLENASAI